MKILIVDDEKLLVKGIKFNFEQDGYTVETAYDGEEALRLAKDKSIDIIILDLMLPKIDGLSVCQKIRDFSRVPIIMLTAKGTEYDKVLGLDLGADDYISKPFGMTELTARVKALLRRTKQAAEVCEKYDIGSLSIYPSSHMVTLDGKELVLSLKEYELLLALVKANGKVLTRDVLLNDIWGYDFDGETRTVDVHIRHLRSKLNDAGSLIETVKGVGYRIGGEPF